MFMYYFGLVFSGFLAFSLFCLVIGLFLSIRKDRRNDITIDIPQKYAMIFVYMFFAILFSSIFAGIFFGC